MTTFAVLYARYRENVFRFLRSRCRNEDDAVDLTAATFERALSAIGRYRPRGAGFGAWLLTGLMQAMLNDVKPTDATVFAATAAAVLVVAVAASYLPARVAGQVDPIVALRDA